MLGSWLIYLIPGLVGTGMLSLVASKKGRKWLRKQRTKMRKRAVKDSKTAVKAHRKVRSATPRGQLRARRAQQPKRLTFGHRRAANDPTHSRIAARKARAAGGRWVEQRKVSRANRKAAKQPKPSPLLELGRRVSAPPRMSRQCGSTATQDHQPCRNRCAPGHDSCYLHVRRAA